MNKYFTDGEFRCKCCGRLPSEGMDSHLLDVLDDMREEVGVPLIISSGYRCPEHNAEVGGVPNSQHVLGIAADVIVPPGYTVDALADIARRCGADGVGSYYTQGFIHVDTRGYQAEWSED